MNIFKQNLDSIWQNAICRRTCTFHLAILTEIWYLAYSIQGSVFFGTPCITTHVYRQKVWSYNRSVTYMHDVFNIWCIHCIDCSNINMCTEWHQITSKIESFNMLISLFLHQTWCCDYHWNRLWDTIQMSVTQYRFVEKKYEAFFGDTFYYNISSWHLHMYDHCFMSSETRFQMYPHTYTKFPHKHPL